MNTESTSSCFLYEALNRVAVCLVKSLTAAPPVLSLLTRFVGLRFIFGTEMSKFAFKLIFLFTLGSEDSRPFVIEDGDKTRDFLESADSGRRILLVVGTKEDEVWVLRNGTGEGPRELELDGISDDDISLGSLM